MKEKELLLLCLEKDRRAQKMLYEKMGSLMKAVCLRYVYDKSLAEEVMNRGFLKVFTKLASYKNKGSFEGWVRRIMVNECLDENRKLKHSYKIDEKVSDNFFSVPPEVDDNYGVSYILQIIEKLPLGYKTVFNMVEIDGFTHKEVSAKLKITESTSRSQLTKAKKMIKLKIENDK